MHHFNMNVKSAYRVVIIGSGFWCLLIIAPAILPETLAPIAYRFFSSICHQFESRSLHLFGETLGVCSRCTAVYLGFWAGALVLPLVSTRISYRPWLLIAMAPMIADVVLEYAGIHGSSTATRLLTGLFFGTNMGLLLTPLMLEGMSRVQRSDVIKQGIEYVPKT